MPDVIYWLGFALIVLGFIGLASPSSREKGEHYTPGWILVGAVFVLLHAYNYARLGGFA